MGFYNKTVNYTVVKDFLNRVETEYHGMFTANKIEMRKGSNEIVATMVNESTSRGNLLFDLVFYRGDEMIQFDVRDVVTDTGADRSKWTERIRDRIVNAMW